MSVLVSDADTESDSTHEAVIRIAPQSDWPGRSAYLFSLHKAGSTLLNGIVEMLCAANDAAFIPLPNLLRRAGHDPNRNVEIAPGAFAETGAVYGGFRLLPDYQLPGLRTAPKILLLRDPRDILTSLYFSVAHSHVAPGEGAMKQAFQRNRDYVKAAPINQIAKERAPNLKKQISRYIGALPRENLSVYHYEDIILNKAAWIDDLSAVLGLQASAETRQAILDRFDLVPESEAPESHVRRVLPGDHRDKLGPKTIDMLDDMFAGIYDPLLPERRRPGAPPTLRKAEE